MMNRKDLYLGMSVCAINVPPESYIYNKLGIVIDVRCPGHEYDCLVEFDENVNGHDGLGWGSVVGKKGHCYWVNACQIEETRCDVPESCDVSYDDLMKGIL